MLDAVDVCAICLAAPQRLSFIDPCFHTFCFECAERWLRVSPRCPLCKSEVGALIYDVVSDTAFRRIRYAGKETPLDVPRPDRSSRASREPPRWAVHRFRLCSDRLPSSVSRNPGRGAPGDRRASPRDAALCGQRRARIRPGPLELAPCTPRAGDDARLTPFLVRELAAFDASVGHPPRSAEASLALARFVLRAARDDGIPGCAVDVHDALLAADCVGDRSEGRVIDLNGTPLGVLLWELARFAETRYEVEAYDALVRYGGRTLEDIVEAHSTVCAEITRCDEEIDAVELELARRRKDS